MSLCQGMRIQLHGLLTQSDLNDAVGCLKHFNASGARWAVELDSGGGVKLFKASNFSVLEMDLQGEMRPSQSMSAACIRQTSPNRTDQQTAKAEEENDADTPVPTTGACFLDDQGSVQCTR